MTKMSPSIFTCILLLNVLLVTTTALPLTEEKEQTPIDVTRISATLQRISEATKQDLKTANDKVSDITPAEDKTDTNLEASNAKTNIQNKAPSEILNRRIRNPEDTPEDDLSVAEQNYYNYQPIFRYGQYVRRKRRKWFPSPILSGG